MSREGKPPAEVRALLTKRRAARDERRWEEADALRDELAAMGWEVQDSAGGSTARPLLPPQPAQTGYADPNDLASLLDDPPTLAVSIQVVADDHPEDLARLLLGLRAHPPSVPFELVMVANAPEADIDRPSPRRDDRAAHEPAPRLGRCTQPRAAPLPWRDHGPARHIARADRRLRGAADGRVRRSHGRSCRRLGGHERRRSRVRGCAAGRGGCHRGLLPGRPPRCAAHSRGIRSSIPVLSQCGSRLQLRRP